MQPEERRGVMETVASFAPDYEREILDENTEREYCEEDARVFLQDADQWTALHYLLRFYLHADHIERYGEPAACALERLGETDHLDAEELCEEFDSVCREEFDYSPLERDRHRLRGATRLYNEHGNVLRWVKSEIEETHTLTPLYEELTDIKWVGRKIATFFLRDAVWLWDIEDLVDEQERVYLQPVDRWVGRAGKKLVPGLKDASEATIAERLADQCNEYGIPNVEFNQGAFYVVAKEAGDPEIFEGMLQGMAAAHSRG